MVLEGLFADPKDGALQLALAGIVVNVQVIPLVEYALCVKEPTATNKFLSKVKPYETFVDGNVRVVQVMPLVDDAAVVTPYEVATNVLLPKATEAQFSNTGNVRNVHVIPSVEEAAVVELIAINTNTSLP
jgi:hypothetical protein